MSDGRIYSSWKPDAEVNDTIQRNENINTNWKYRQYLTNNGLQIMKINNQEACHMLGLPSHLEAGTTPSSNVPYLYNSVFDNKNPGYGYNNSDLKNPYLSREKLQARVIAPTISVQQVKLSQQP
jgi:hypothetical protein